jgi:hypothetical protein
LERIELASEIATMDREEFSRLSGKDMSILRPLRDCVSRGEGDLCDANRRQRQRQEQGQRKEEIGKGNEEIGKGKEREEGSYRREL